jgi:DNA modification methylase
MHKDQEQRESLKIVSRSINELKPYERNARTHSKKQLRKIAAIISNVGFLNPIIADATGRILAGHGRLEAAKMLGMTEVPTVQVGHLTEAQIRAYILADNRIAEEAGWDKAMLKIELQYLQMALPDLNFDLDLTGFDEKEISFILGNTAEDEVEDDVIPLEKSVPSITKTGDCWILEKHCVMCGDATNREDVDHLMNGEKAAMVVTDPPYNVDYGKNKKDSKHKPIANDALGSHFLAFLTIVCGILLSVTEGAVYICMSSSELPTLQKAFIDAGGHWSSFIIWAKNNFTLGRSDYQRQYEPILYGWRDGATHHWCGDRNQGDIWFFDKPTRNDIHPTMKPVGLIMRAIRNSSQKGDIVLDCFLGSGTTLIAAERTGRICYGLELDPHYVDAAVIRWQRRTGRKAILAGTKHTFDEILSERGQK